METFILWCERVRVPYYYTLATRRYEPLSDDFRDLISLGHEQIGPICRIFELFRRCRQRHLVTREQSGLHAVMLGRGDVAIDPRADVQNILRLHAARPEVRRAPP